jgi:hypothetical protein
MAVPMRLLCDRGPSGSSRDGSGACALPSSERDPAKEPGTFLRLKRHPSNQVGRDVMKIILAAALALTGLAASVGSTPAMTIAPGAANSNTLLQTIAGGCGRGFHPNPWGRCVPNRYDEYAPRRGYGPDPGYALMPRYYRQPEYAPAPIYRGGCPYGKHPGNSGRCVPDY